METGGSPSFPGDPVTALPCSQTPGGPPRQTLAALRCCPRYHHNEGSPFPSNFEAPSHGFTTRCLRLKTPFLNANQGSLPVDGQSFPGGIGSRRVSPVAFSCSLSVSPFCLLLLTCERTPRLSGLWLAPDDCGLRIFELNLLGAKARFQAQIRNQKSSIGNHQSSSGLTRIHSFA